MLKTSLLGLPVVAALLAPGWGCTHDTPRIANPSRTTTTTPRTPVPPIVTPPGPSAGCQLLKADQPMTMAFCDTFDAPHNGGTRTGDLDPVLWGVSRVGIGNQGQGWYNIIPDSHLVGCGSNAAVATPNDVRVCNGQLVESVYDDHDVVNLDMYPKQPFDFANRTGTVSFDVSNDSQGNHAAWPEFIITDKPIPGARMDISTGVPAAAANEIGFALDAGCGGTNDTAGVGTVYVTRNNTYQDIPFTPTGCVSRGSSNAMNHFEFRISTNHVEVWASDAGSSSLRQIAVADNVGLTFTKGLVWLTDAHYNACKIAPNSQCDHTFFWDNLAFDGPKTYRDLGFDVPDATTRIGAGTGVGYPVGPTPSNLTVTGVRRDKVPTGALVVFNTYSRDQNVIPSVSLDGGQTWVDTPWPYNDSRSNSWRSIAVPVPLDKVHDGTNTLTFKCSDGSTMIANISLILVNASPVP